MDPKRALLNSVKSFDIFLTIALFIWERIARKAEDDEILYYLFMSSILLRTILNSITMRQEVRSSLKYFCMVQALQIIPIGLLTAGVIRGLFFGNTITHDIWFALAEVIVWIFNDIIVTVFTVQELRKQSGCQPLPEATNV